jgi:hypothetical protein
VRVRVLAEIPNSRVAKGVPFLLLVAEDGKFARGVQIGERTEVLSPWVDPQKALDGAVRVLGGDHRAATHPTTLMALSLALVGLLMEGKAQEISERQKEGGE